MLKKQITYTNPFTEKDVVEELYFHISKADLIKLEVEHSDDRYQPKGGGEEVSGMRAHFMRIQESEDVKVVMKEFDAILKLAYGKKEGERFIKTQEAWDEFYGSEAYSELIFQMLKDPAQAAEFFAQVVPAGLRATAEEIEAAANGATPASEKVEAALTPDDQAAAEALTKNENVPTPDQGVRVLTRAELIDMDNDELQAGLASGRYKLS